jgi:hypothetical protein
MSTSEIEDLVRAQIFATSGRPRDFVMMKMIKISEHCYRVNMYVRVNNMLMETLAIDDSYFITLDDENNVIDSEPPIRKRYTPI